MNLSEEKVRQTLAQMMHPEINRSLIDLGMIKDVTVKGNDVTLTLALPFLGIPIKDYLVQIVKEAVMNLSTDVKVEVKLLEMNEEERAKFMAMAQEWWKL